MKRMFILPAIFICLFLLGAGCTAPDEQEQQTPVPTTVPVTLPVSTTPVPTPIITPAFISGPLPSEYSVDVTIDRNTITTNPIITAEFRGGKGASFVRQVEVIVRRSDGIVETGTMDRPGMGDSVVLEGTTSIDHIEVYVLLINGDRYRIIDDDYPFR